MLSEDDYIVALAGEYLKKRSTLIGRITLNFRPILVCIVLITCSYFAGFTIASDERECPTIHHQK